MALEKTDASQVVTWAPPSTPGGLLTDPRWLGQYGNVSGLQYNSILPGGCGPMQCALLAEGGSETRPSAINEGRVVQIYRGAGPIWEGKLAEPAPSASGWNLTATGNGSYGDQFDAIWSTWNQNDALNQAIARGLRWRMPSGGLPSGLFLSQQQDSGSQNITSFMNMLCSAGGYTWKVGPYNDLSVFVNPVPPLKPTRLLVVQAPVGRTVVDVNYIYGKYQITADPTTTTDSSGTDTASSTAAATYGNTFVENASDIAVHQPNEVYADFSNATNISTAGAAQAAMNNILALYQRIAFTGTFTAMPGDLMTMGGTQRDLGCEVAGEIYQLLLCDFGYGSEVIPGPVCVVGGQTQYNDDTQVLTITPLGAANTSFSGLLASAVAQNTPPPSTSS